MKRLISIIVAGLVLGSLVACTAIQPTVSPVATAGPSPRPESPLPTGVAPASPLATAEIDKAQTGAGKSSLDVTLFSPSISGPIYGTVFYLYRANDQANPQPPAVLSSARPEAGDIRGTTDERGHISLKDIPAGNYYLAVQAPYQWLLVPVSPVDETPLLFKLEPGQHLDKGTLQMYWP